MHVVARCVPLYFLMGQNWHRSQPVCTSPLSFQTGNKDSGDNRPRFWVNLDPTVGSTKAHKTSQETQKRVQIQNARWHILWNNWWLKQEVLVVKGWVYNIHKKKIRSPSCNVGRRISYRVVWRSTPIRWSLTYLMTRGSGRVMSYCGFFAWESPILDLAWQPRVSPVKQSLELGAVGWSTTHSHKLPWPHVTFSLRLNANYSTKILPLVTKVYGISWWFWITTELNKTSRSKMFSFHQSRRIIGVFTLKQRFNMEVFVLAYIPFTNLTTTFWKKSTFWGLSCLRYGAHSNATDGFAASQPPPPTWGPAPYPCQVTRSMCVGGRSW